MVESRLDCMHARVSCHEGQTPDPEVKAENGGKGSERAERLWNGQCRTRVGLGTTDAPRREQMLANRVQESLNAAGQAPRNDNVYGAWPFFRAQMHPVQYSRVVLPWRI